MIRVYIIGPYRAKNPWNVELNVRRAENCAYELFDLGFAVHCPHTNSRFFDNSIPDQMMLDATSKWLEVSDAAVLLENWELSEGSTQEAEKAKELSIPVFKSVADLVQWFKNTE